MAMDKGWKSIFNSGRPVGTESASGGFLSSIGQILRTPSPAFQGSTASADRGSGALVESSGGSLLADLPDQEYILFLVAKQLFQNGHILCFDEIQLVDVAGAGLLRGILAYFWRMGGVIVGTSNRVPQDLYQSGVHRESFLEFLTILSDRCPPHDMRSPVDWRKTKYEEEQQTNIGQDFESRWYQANRPEEMAKFQDRLDSSQIESMGEAKTLHVYGRVLKIPLALDSIAKFSFKNLCELVSAAP